VTQLLFTFRIDPKFMKFITEKKTNSDIEYDLYFDCEKFDEIYGKKFEIPRNMRIVRHSK
jgi:hypothetical protein